MTLSRERRRRLLALDDYCQEKYGLPQYAPADVQERWQAAREALAADDARRQRREAARKAKRADTGRSWAS